MVFEGKNGLPSVMLAPMAGFTDRAMRVVCHEQGADAAVTEMISAKAVTFGDKKTKKLAKIGEDEGPVALQLFGSEPDVIARAAEEMTRPQEGGVAPVAIDINMGCPVAKIYGNGEGSALMRDPEKIERIVAAAKGATDLPVTVKLRAGIDAEHKNAVACALAAEAGGAAAICVHGRTRVEFYSGRADREIIGEVKRAVKIAVIANGDVASLAEAQDMLRRTGADGLMIARGAIGNPFLFAEIKAGLAGIPYTPPSREKRVETALRQLSLAILDKGERVAVTESRKSVSLYLSGYRGAAAARAKVHLASTYKEVEEILRASLVAGNEPDGAGIFLDF